MKQSNFKTPRTLEECVFIESADPFSWSATKDQIKRMVKRATAFNLIMQRKRRFSRGKSNVEFWG